MSVFAIANANHRIKQTIFKVHDDSGDSATFTRAADLEAWCEERTGIVLDILRVQFASALV